jgi:NAD-dependent dihydropyrimidine dehydrogenase PreA subunit
MTYVIAQPCVDVKDKSCVEQCPVDCIYEGSRALYINPEECVECGACEPACPMDAVYYDADLPAEFAAAVQSNLDFFRLPLPDRLAPIGNPGGARDIGPLDADTEFVRSLPPLAPR